MPAPDLRIHLFGSFGLFSQGEVVKGLDHARLQELLAYILLHRGSRVPRQQLAFTFWPDSTEEQARTNFRNLWHRLRRALPEADRFLMVDALTVQWRGCDECWLDVAAFEAALGRAGSSAKANEQIAMLEQAVATYGGELLPGCYSDWLLFERDRLAQAYGAAREQLVFLYEARRDYRKAIDHAQALLRHDPLHEPAYAQLMRLNALNDDRAAALHTYHTCATIMRRELDVEPGPTTKDIYERLVRAKPRAPVPERTEAAIPLVGREAEWMALMGAWRAAAGRPQLVVISGEAGIGKTRLADALAEWVGRQGVPVLAARSYEAGGDLAYAPVVTWLRSQPRPVLADPWLRELARLFPEIRTERPDLPAPEPLAENWQRLRLFEALARTLLTGHRDLLLLLDDIQWCDRDTLDWLLYLLAARSETETRVQLLVVATSRSEESDTGAALAKWRSELARTGQLTGLEIGPLSREATLMLADHVAGQPLDRSLARLLHQDTEGYPLFIVEMVRAGFGQSVSQTAGPSVAMPAIPTAMPDKVHRVLEARLSQLSPRTREVIDLASVVGRAFTYGVLAHATDLSEDLLVAALDEGWRKRIIREQGEDAYDFSHDKLREAAYGDLSRARRRWLHGRVARALAQVHAADLERVAGMIAAHFEAAQQSKQAIAYYERAATWARRIYAHADALAALERALSLSAALPGDVGCELSPRLHEELGDLRELVAQHGHARDAYAAALACTPAANAIAQARLHRKIGKSLENERVGYAMAAAQYERAEALLGAPGEAAGSAWWEEWCQVQIEHLIVLYWWNRPTEMAQRIQHVQALIERHGTPLQRAALFGNMSRQQSRACRFAPSAAALASARAAVAALPDTTGPEARAVYQFGLGFHLLWHGDYAEAEQAVQVALDLAQQTGDITQQARCLIYLAVVHRQQDHIADVLAYARQGLAAAEAAGTLEYVAACQANLAWLAWRQDDLAEAERLGQAALEAWRQYAAPYPFHWLALWPLIGVALAQNRLPDAISYARQLLDPIQQALPFAIAQPLTAALTASDAGRRDEANDLLRRSLALAEQTYFS